MNPTSILLSASLMLRHLGELQSAQAVERAVEETIREKQKVTRDLGGAALRVLGFWPTGSFWMFLDVL